DRECSNLQLSRYCQKALPRQNSLPIYHWPRVFQHSKSLKSPPAGNFQILPKVDFLATWFGHLWLVLDCFGANENLRRRQNFLPKSAYYREKYPRFCHSATILLDRYEKISCHFRRSDRNEHSPKG